MSPPKDPILSIVIPSYNQARFLSDCLSEPLSYPGLVQAIVMDGGSKDGSVEILTTTLSEGHYWQSQPDGGQAAAINSGFARAGGAWIAFQNSDDFYVDGVLADILDVIDSSNADIIIGGAAACDVDGKIFKTMMPKPIFYPAMSVMNFLNNQSLFVKKSYLEKIGYLDGSLQFCLDYEWFLRLLRPNPRIHYIDKVIGVQRMHEDTKTSNIKHVHDIEFSRLRTIYFSKTERALGRASIDLYRAFRFAWPIYKLALSRLRL